MKKLRHVNSINEVMSPDFSLRIKELAEYLDKNLCPVEQTRRFYKKARRLVADLTEDSENSLARIYNLVRIMLTKLGELHPEYRYDKEEIDMICNASIFHDLGKFLLPENVLKKPDKLLPEEAELIHRHTEFGYEIMHRVGKIASCPYARYFEEICRYHHERWDGDGYPLGLVGAQIPIYVQVVAVIDVYDALISRREYKPTYSHTAAMEMIESGDCGFFNPIILDCFRQVSEQMRLEAEHYKTTPKYKQAWLYRALKRLNYVVSFSLIAVASLMAVSFGFFAVSLNDSVTQDKQQQMSSLTSNVSKLWVQKMRGDVSLLKSGVTGLYPKFQSLTPGPQSPDYRVAVNDTYRLTAQQQNYSVYAVFTSAEAEASASTIYAYRDEDVVAVQYDYAGLRQILRGVTTFSEWDRDAIVERCLVQDVGDVWTEGFFIAVPVFREGMKKTHDSVVGFVTCAYKSIDLIRDLDASIFGDTHIFTMDGGYIYSPENVTAVDFYDQMSGMNFLGDDSLLLLRDSISKRKSGVVHYEENEIRKYGYYTFVNFVIPITDGLTSALSDWCVFVSFEEETVMQYATQIQRSMIFFFVVIGVLLLGLVVLVSTKLRQVLRITKEMAVQYDDIRQNLEMSENKYKTVIAQTKHMVFEFDHSTQIVTHTEATASRYGFPMVYKFDPVNPVIRERVHPDDYDAYQKMYHDVLGGKESAEANLRLKLTTGEYVWNRCTMHNIYDNEKRAVKSIGFAEDVDNILTETQHLRDTAMRDSFTNLYNKTYTEILINKELSEAMSASAGEHDSMHAFMIMDLDKFKNINDSFGHATGDMILKNFSSLLSRNARGYDLVGRVGGDEFVLFMRDIRDESAAINKAKTLIELARLIGGTQVACSISVGIAYAPTDGLTYQELYENADKALYVAKNNGGNNWSAV